MHDLSLHQAQQTPRACNRSFCVPAMVNPALIPALCFIALHERW